VAWALAAADPDEALRVARTIGDEDVQARALAWIAAELAGSEPERGRALNAEAEDLAEEAPAVAAVIAAAAVLDPGRVPELAADARAFAARSVPDRLRLAEACATTHPAEARALLADADAAATDAFELGEVARVLAGIDRDRALHLATQAEWLAFGRRRWWQPQRSPGDLDDARHGIVGALAVLDPRRALAMAGEIGDADLRRIALTAAVRGLAPVDPDEAERVARANSDDEDPSTIVALVEGLAATDPGRALRVAAAITDDASAASALASLL
jgi:hypothetical protein